MLFIGVGHASHTSSSGDSDHKRNISYNTTYGYMDGDYWVVPSRIWIHKNRRWLQRFVAWMIDLTSDYTDEQVDIFKNRLLDITANSKSRRTVTIRFKNDPEERTFRITDSDGEQPRSDRNGIITGNLEIPVDTVNELFEYQNSEDGWLTATLSSSRYTGTGRIRFLEPEGLSVISDIDDTIKITEIPAGAKVVVRNTFFKEYQAAPLMNDLYGEWEDASFHYVSGAPWQKYRSLSTFLIGKSGFPEGSFHMKNTRKNPLTINTWRDLRELITNELVTYDQKVSQISQLFEHFPGREFILVGDSGELDPEVYNHIRNQYPEQIRKIIIRDVVNARENTPERLEEMTVLPAPTIYRYEERQREIVKKIEEEEPLYEE